MKSIPICLFLRNQFSLVYILISETRIVVYRFLRFGHFPVWVLQTFIIISLIFETNHSGRWTLLRTRDKPFDYPKTDKFDLDHMSTEPTAWDIYCLRVIAYNEVRPWRHVVTTGGQFKYFKSFIFFYESFDNVSFAWHIQMIILLHNLGREKDTATKATLAYLLLIPDIRDQPSHKTPLAAVTRPLQVVATG